MVRVPRTECDTPRALAVQANAHLVHHMTDIAMSKAAVCPAGMSPADMALDDGSLDHPSYFVIVDDSRIVGVIARDWALGHAAELRAADRVDQLAQHDYVIVAPDTTLFELLAAMQERAASVAIVATSNAPAADAAH